MRMRIAASAAVTVLVTAALSGCMLVTPQQTARGYTPSDGVNGDIGDIAVRNVLLVTGGGGDASMLGVLANGGARAASVTLQYATAGGTGTTTLTVPGNGVLSLRPNTGAQTSTSVTTQTRDVTLTGLGDVTAGRLYSVGFAVGASPPVTLRVPVLNGDLPEYASLVPTPTVPATPSAQPGESSPSNG